jgi:hypothetical protein
VIFKKKVCKLFKTIQVFCSILSIHSIQTKEGFPIFKTLILLLGWLYRNNCKFIEKTFYKKATEVINVGRCRITEIVSKIEVSNKKLNNHQENIYHQLHNEYF